MGSGPPPCPCRSRRPFADCCAPYLTGEQNAPTAEALMRSRFTAYALGDLAYVARTWHPSTRPADLSPDPDTTWVALQIVETTAGRESDDTGTVHFRASFRTPTGRDVLEEISRFTRQNGAWVYVDGDILT
ncbi:SEC-C motif-containing protein [Serinibacter salmoneus]|uniref:UPF0225 protein ATL40_2535 n=2 Tax=Serinibacter salmoneus TaxID=556530 RepID=A0A2A9D4Z1_9MICO|nr:YchJ family protein [Serinibacter salmoneus]PFG20919.1 SEC-C motif-containing protein [Serinibacter salmoneus]